MSSWNDGHTLPPPMYDNPYEKIYRSYNILSNSYSTRADAESIARHLGMVVNTFGIIVKDFINVMKYKFPNQSQPLNESICSSCKNKFGNQANVNLSNPLSMMEIGEVNLQQQQEQQYSQKKRKNQHQQRISKTNNHLNYMSENISNYSQSPMSLYDQLEALNPNGIYNKNYQNQRNQSFQFGNQESGMSFSPKPQNIGQKQVGKQRTNKAHNTRKEKQGQVLINNIKGSAKVRFVTGEILTKKKKKTNRKGENKNEAIEIDD